MEKTNFYRSVLREIIDRYAQFVPSYGDIELETICDRDRYFLLGFGWNGNRCIRTTMLHLRLANEKVWIERDETEEGVAQDLLDLGIPASDIVLAFYHPEDRQFADFAIA